MFGAPLPDLEEYGELADKATKAFTILKDAIHEAKPEADSHELIQEALFAWATVHGLASITQTGSFSALGIQGPAMMDEAIRYALGNICRAINGPEDRLLEPPL